MWHIVGFFQVVYCSMCGIFLLYLVFHQLLNELVPVMVPFIVYLYIFAILKAGNQEFKRLLLLGMKIGTSLKMKVCFTSLMWNYLSQLMLHFSFYISNKLRELSGFFS
jgi:hypothetical protein